MIDPRGVLAEFGLELADGVEVVVWDSTAEVRYLVLPERPAGSEGLDEAALAHLVTRDSMIGTGLALTPDAARAAGATRMNGVHDLGGMQGFGPVEAEADEPVFHAEWERRVFALTLAMAAPGGWNIDMSRHARESLPPAQYLSSSYYEIWLAALETADARAWSRDRRRDRPRATARLRQRPVAACSRPNKVAAALARGAPADRPSTAEARFAVGEPVRA